MSLKDQIVVQIYNMSVYIFFSLDFFHSDFNYLCCTYSKKVGFYRFLLILNNCGCGEVKSIYNVRIKFKKIF